MPAKSASQERLMQAAAHTQGGYGGVPQKVGQEFVGDKEEIKGAGIMYITPDDEVLFLLRSPDSNNPNCWDLPGGKADEDETPEQTAERESAEEVGAAPYGELSEIASTNSEDDSGHNVGFITFRKFIRHKFTPKLDLSEHTDYRWAKLEDAPEPLHPGVREVVNIASGSSEDKPAMDGLAFDRASVRSIDADGRMHVELSHISKAMICPYMGTEIPYSEELGLDPEKIYMLLRDPEELKKSVSTWNGVPLLNDHIAVSAEDHQPQAVVGATGTDAAFNAPYLDNSLVIWSQEAIDGVNSGQQQEISCSYRYKPDMTPGVYEGEAYDGVMRDIVANHVALVSRGRAGPDVLVNDSLNFNGAVKMGKTLSKKAVMAKGVLIAALKPGVLAADSHLDLNKVLADVKRKNWLQKKPGVIAAIKPHLAKDADIGQLMDLLDKLDGNSDNNDISMDDEDMEDMTAMDDKCESILAKLRGKISDVDLAEIESMLTESKPAMDEPPQTENAANADPKDQDDKEPIPAKDEEDKDMEKEKEKEEKMDKAKAAMDRAIKLACDATAMATEKKTIARLRDIAEAEEMVRPYVGKLTAMDSSEEVFKAALSALNVDIKDVHPSAYKTILKHLPNPNAPKRAEYASDSSMSPTADIYAQFPDLLN